MCKSKTLLIILFSVSVVPISNAANVIYVDANGPNDPGTGSFADPFLRIQDALDAATNGDTVEIRPGLYTGLGNYDLDPNGLSITIRSTDPNDSSIVANTIIDPNGAGRGFYFHSGEDANCVVLGLTIRNGYIAANGANIYSFDSSPMIRNCVIRDGYAEGGSGGGICFDYGNAAIINSIVTYNTADYYGGGISCRFSSPIIIGCTINGNTAGLEGGGIDSGKSTPNIVNCIIIDNNAALGGGINCYFPGDANVVNCTLAANSADYFGGAVHCWYGGSAIIKKSILWANSAPDGIQLGLKDEGTASVAYCDVQGGQSDVYDPCELLVWGDGNIDKDPCFASFNLNGDPNMWDFHLQSAFGRFDSVFYKIDFNHDGVINLLDFAKLADRWLEKGYNLPGDLNHSGAVDEADLQIFSEYYLSIRHEGKWAFDRSTSPCIDAGDPNSDWSAEPWPNGKRINMGAYGGTIQASKNGNPADFDIDGSVNLVDFAGLADKWFAEEFCIEDLTNNRVVDIDDLRIFAENWLWQRE